jgi:hypothetical protein
MEIECWPARSSFKGVQPVRRRVAQIVHRLRSVEHRQLAERAILDVRRQLAAAQAVPDALGFLVCEAGDHGSLRYGMSKENICELCGLGLA